MMERELYLVLSQTGSWLSSAIKVVTRKEFNHVSLSLSSELDPMWSFGRKHAYNPLVGAFVKEYLYKGTFHRFQRTKCEVLLLKISPEQYDAMLDFLETMHRDGYGYNFIGLFFAAFGKHLPRSKKFYCSEFVSMLLRKFNVEGASELPAVSHPCDFRKLSGVTCVYRGLLKDYPTQKQ